MLSINITIQSLVAAYTLFLVITTMLLFLPQVQVLLRMNFNDSHVTNPGGGKRQSTISVQESS